MAGVYKPPADRLKKGTVWRVWYRAADGRRRWVKGFVDRAESVRLGATLEAEARKERYGLAGAGERTARQQALRPIAEHIEDYRRDVLSRGGTARHAKHVAGALTRLLTDASAPTLATLALDRVQAALGRLRAVRSARTANHALGAFRAFVRWLADAGRLVEVPRGLGRLKPYPQGDDHRRIRRALSEEELDRLLAATEAGPEVVTRRTPRSAPGRHPTGKLTGPDRAILYHLAMATGFRAAELASLTPESFQLSGDSPTITVRACYSKRGKRSGRDDVQPIRRDVAELLQGWLAGREPHKPVLAVPEKTAELLRADLERAGIPYRDEKGRVVDFHALRHSYITMLVRRGVNPKLVQKLARHSTITLTLDRYTSVDDAEVRDALED
jgi:integrase/recombinase XerD